jgi:choice-of-anchor A domain-containing protein
MRLALLSAPILLALSGPLAQADTALTLGPASGYNVFILGAYSTPGSTDIQGSVAVGGAFIATGSLSINQSPGGGPAPSTVGLVVGGNLTLAGGQLDNTNAGDAYVGGNVSSSSFYNFEHNLNYSGTLTPANITVVGTTAHPTTIPINFTSAATTLDQLSNTLQGLAANGSVALGAGSVYTLTGSACSVCVFDLTGGVFSGSSITINAPSGATVVINVSGTADSFTNSSINYIGGITANDTIFNFNSATTLITSGTTVNGSILAPFATFTGMNGSVDGELIAASVTGESAELESAFIFNGNLGSLATPEPATWMLMAVAPLACVFIRARQVRT